MKKFQQAIIHIGLHKTGSTSIQNALFKERQWLAEHANVHYPSLCDNHSIPLTSLFCKRNINLNHLRLNLTSPELIKERRKQCQQSLEKGFQETLCSRLLLSGEGLSKWRINEVEAFRDWLAAFAEQVKIVTFIREPFSWATSVAQQTLKSGRLLEMSYHNPYSLKETIEGITPWFTTYGKEAFKALDFNEACQHPHGILGAFLEIAELPQSFLEVAPTNHHANTSFCAGAAFLLNALNKVHPLVLDGKINPLRRSEKIHHIQNLRGSKFQLPPAVLKIVKEKSKEAAQWLQETFGIHYSLDIPETTELSTLFDDESAAHIALCVMKYSDTPEDTRNTDPAYIQAIEQLNKLNHQLEIEQQARHKAEKKLQQVNKKLKQTEKRSKSFKNQVETWNHRSWWKRAFHRLRLKE